MIRHASCFATLWLLGVVASDVCQAQSAARDSLPTTSDAASPALRLDVRPLSRRYTVGDFAAAEHSLAVTLDGQVGRVHVSITAIPLRFTGDTSSSDRQAQTLRGIPGVTAELGFRVSAADTVSILARSASSPVALSTADAAALGAVSTAVSQFDAASVGVPASLSAGYAMGRLIGNAITLHVALAGDVEPRPADGSLSYWQGTTVRGSLGLSGGGPRTMIRADVSGSRSSADSLDGSNLFSGGGTIVGALSLGYFARADSSVLVTLNTRYGKPFSQTRQEVPSRAIPVGATLNVDLSLSASAGWVTVSPGVSWLSETSSAVRRVNNRVSRVSGSSSSASAHLALVFPIGTRLTVTPDFGGVIGRVAQTVSGPASLRFGRSALRSGSFSDDVRGFYASVGFTLGW